MRKIKIVNRYENHNALGPPKSNKKKVVQDKFNYEGYRLMSYDATYEKTMFEVYEHDDVLEVEELNSGMRFIVFKKGGKVK